MFHFKFSLIVSSVALCAFGGQSHAAPVSNLTFDISAKIAAQGAGNAPTQTMKARVLLHGNRARIETNYASQKSVTLLAPPYVYRLLPDSKAGVRWKADAKNAARLGGMNPQELLRNPGKIRTLLLNNGAKRTGAGVLNGVAVEIYQIQKPKGALSSARAWLRKSDSLPLKLEAAGNGLAVSAIWSNYARPKTLSDTLFRVPGNYRIREARNAPPLSLF